MSLEQEQKRQPEYDAVVVGAGFGGLYMLHRFANTLGLSVRLFDRAEGVGGTWYWNRYPGARSDVESYVYSYSFDPELRDEWNWKDRYPKQEEILSYLEHVADRYDLRRHITFGSGVTRACFDDESALWQIETDQGETFSCRYLVTALGLLSATNYPDIPGRDRFTGTQYHTGNWPRTPVDFRGKRVGVIGTGSTGVQLITAMAPRCAHLTVFQRTPQYSVPARYGPMPADFIADVKANYEAMWDRMRKAFIAAGFDESGVSYHEVSEAERDAVWEKAWEQGGGFRFMFGTFYDVALDEDANESAAKFIRNKIRSIVKNEDTARILTPTGLYARRPICDMGYYDTFNRSNVTLVDIAQSPLQTFTKTGLKTASNTYDLDILIYATGFEAVDGNYYRMDIRGRGGRTIQDKWKDGASSYLGMAVPGFPNMFMILGSNSVFANIPPVIESQVEWIAEAIRAARERGCETIEATAAAERSWLDLCRASSDRTLFGRVDSWIFGANIPGKPRTVMFNMNGLGAYRTVLDEVVRNNYDGFDITTFEPIVIQGK